MIQNKFWIIFCTTGNPAYESKPAYKLKKHDNEKDAVTELHRLAKQHPAKEFVMMRSVCAASASAVHVVTH